MYFIVLSYFKIHLHLKSYLIAIGIYNTYHQFI